MPVCRSTRYLLIAFIFDWLDLDLFTSHLYEERVSISVLFVFSYLQEEIIYSEKVKLKEKEKGRKRSPKPFKQKKKKGPGLSIWLASEIQTKFQRPLSSPLSPPNPVLVVKCEETHKAAFNKVFPLCSKKRRDP